MNLPALTILVRISIDPVDIVLLIEGMHRPRVSIAMAVNTPTLKEHDADVNPLVPGGNHPRPQPIEVFRIELTQIILRFAIQGGSRCRAGVSDGGVILVVLSALPPPCPAFPRPHSHEIVIEPRHQFQVAVVVES